MKYFISIAAIILFTINANAYELKYVENGNMIKWPEGQIDIYLDSSLELIEEDTYTTIEESFLEWSDYIEKDIILNFIYEDCSPEKNKNCVRYTSPEDFTTDTVAHTVRKWIIATGEIQYCNIEILTHWDIEYIRRNLKNIILHEIGHFFGLEHSDNRQTIMYKGVNVIEELHQDDINGIKTLYGNGIIYPSIEEKIEYHYMGCSINKQSISKSIWNLLF